MVMVSLGFWWWGGGGGGFIGIFVGVVVGLLMVASGGGTRVVVVVVLWLLVVVLLFSPRRLHYVKTLAPCLSNHFYEGTKTCVIWFVRIISVFFCPQADISGEKAQSQELYGILLIGIHAAMVIAIIVQAYFAVQVRAPRKNRRRKFPEEISVLSTMTPFVVAAVIKRYSVLLFMSLQVVSFIL